MGLIEAVKELRSRLGMTQQAFATKLGLSIRAIANYESGRVPRGNALRLIARSAEEAGFGDLATIFREALGQELGTWDPGDFTLRLEPQTAIEKLWVSAILAVLRNARYARLIPRLVRLLRTPAEQSIEILESHKEGVKLKKEALALLDQGRPAAEVAAALDIPVQTVRNLAFHRELHLAFQRSLGGTK